MSRQQYDYLFEDPYSFLSNPDVRHVMAERLRTVPESLHIIARDNQYVTMLHGDSKVYLFDTIDSAKEFVWQKVLTELVRRPLMFGREPVVNVIRQRQDTLALVVCMQHKQTPLPQEAYTALLDNRFVQYCTATRNPKLLEYYDYCLNATVDVRELFEYIKRSMDWLSVLRQLEPLAELYTLTNGWVFWLGERTYY